MFGNFSERKSDLLKKGESVLTEEICLQKISLVFLSRKLKVELPDRQISSNCEIISLRELFLVLKLLIFNVLRFLNALKKLGFRDFSSLSPLMSIFCSSSKLERNFWYP